MTISLPASSASTPKPWPSVSSRMPREPSGLKGTPLSMEGMARTKKIALIGSGGLRVQPLRRLERDGAGSGDVDAVVLVDLRVRHELVEEDVPRVPLQVDLAVADPFHRVVPGEGGDAGADRRSRQTHGPHDLHEALLDVVVLGAGAPVLLRARRSARRLIRFSCVQFITTSPVEATSA